MPTYETKPGKKQDIYHLVGTRLKDRYLLDEFVDEGGMSIVYRAHDSKNGSIVAVKILAPRFLTRQDQAETYLKLFRQEVEVTQKLKHPNIVATHDSGVENGIAFIVLEWLEGRTLGEELTRSGPLSVARTAVILKQVCTALDVAHRQKIIHLDLKPNNIFLLSEGTPYEQVKVIDFGLARIMQSTLGTTISRVVGTPFYIAPEVFANKASRLSDIYSLGVLTYELLTGLRPFSQSHIYALVHQHIEEPPPSARTANPNIPELIDELIKRAMNKSPAYRPKSAPAFYDEFALVLASFPERSVVEKTSRPVVYVSEHSFLNRLRKPIKTIFVLASLLITISSGIYFVSPFPGLIGLSITRIESLLIYTMTTAALFFVFLPADSRHEGFFGRLFAALTFTILSPLLWALPVILPISLIVLVISQYIRSKQEDKS